MGMLTLQAFLAISSYSEMKSNVSESYVGIYIES